jgi:spermidine synthase
MSRREVAIIAHTMLEVFPQVTVWRGDWKVNTPTLGLIGQVAVGPLDTAVVARRLAGTEDPALLVPGWNGRGASPLLWGYCGNLTAARALVEQAPLNTDDHPLIEYLAPVTHRQTQAGQARFMTRDQMLRLFADLQAAVPAERDPYLAQVPVPDRRYVRAGFLNHATAVLRSMGASAEAEQAQAEMRQLLAEPTGKKRAGGP